jgi:hypothetical protein
VEAEYNALKSNPKTGSEDAGKTGDYIDLMKRHKVID